MRSGCWSPGQRRGMRLNTIWELAAGRSTAGGNNSARTVRGLFPENGKSRDEELAALRKENKELREERDILRKATAIFSRPPR